MSGINVQAIVDFDSDDNPQIARMVAAVWPLPPDRAMLDALAAVLVQAASDFLEERKLATGGVMRSNECAPLGVTIH